MIKKLLFIFLFIGAYAQAQNKQLRDTAINDKVYHIYPYTLVEDISSTDTDNKIPPVLDSLPSGNYLLIRNIVFTKGSKKRIKKTIKAEFAIEFGKLHGQVTFYDVNHSVTAKGHYNKGLKDGEWNFFPSTGHIMINYVNGIQRGPRKNFILRDGKSLLHKDYFSVDCSNYFNDEWGDETEDNCFTSYYKEYYDNGTLKLVCTSDTICSFRSLSNDEYLSYAAPKMFADVQRGQQWILPNRSTFTIYHSNGSILGKIARENDQKNLISCEFDTLFSEAAIPVLIRKPAGKINDTTLVFLYINDRNGKAYSKKIFYNSPNSAYFYEYALYMYDSLGTENLVWSAFGRIPQISKADSLQKLSSILESFYEEEVYTSSYLPEQLLKRTGFKNSFRSDFEVLELGPHYRYKKYFTMGALQAVAYTSSHNFTSTGREGLNHLLSNVFSDVFMHCDSAFINYEGNPYSGLLIFKKGKTKLIFDKKRNALVMSSPDFQNAEMEVQFGKIVSYQYDWNEKYVKSGWRGYDYFVDRPLYGKGKVFFTLKDDLLHGEYTRTKYDKRTKRYTPLTSKSYRFGKLDGIETKYNYDGSLKEFGEYKNGKKVGTHIEFSYDGSPEQITNYDDLGMKDGLELHFGNTRLGQVTSYRKGQRDGRYLLFNQEGDTVAKIDYSKGQINGAYFTKYLKTHLSMGLAIAPIAFYDDHDSLRFKLTPNSDSIYLYHYRLEAVHGVNDWEELKIGGVIEIFYPHGILYAKGKIKYKNASQNLGKIGPWSYYNVLGNLSAQVIYDSLKMKTLVNEYYPNGQLKYEGTLLSENKRQECESDIMEVDFDLNYNYCFSATGDTLVKDGNGYVQVSNLNGLILREGLLKDGKKEGLWKEYSKEGKISGAGKYDNGLKQGRWLYGDLTGINYLDDRCFQDEEQKRILQEEQRFSIKIEEIIYVDGEEVSTVIHHFERAK